LAEVSRGDDAPLQLEIPGAKSRISVDGGELPKRLDFVGIALVKSLKRHAVRLGKDKADRCLLGVLNPQDEIGIKPAVAEEAHARFRGIAEDVEAPPSKGPPGMMPRPEHPQIL